MENIVTSKDKYQITILIIVVIFILLIIFALIFRHVDRGNNNKNTVGVVLTDGDLAINFIDGDQVKVKNSEENSYSISITNTGDTRVYYSVYFDEVTNPEATVIVEDYDGKEISKTKEDLDTKKIINLQYLDPSGIARYRIKIKATEGLFKGKFVVINDSISSDSFAELILSTHQVGVPKTRVGSEIATQNEGLLSTVDNKGTTYYFRGSVNNNYVRLGKLMFRIVRINGNGTVRLVLDNVIEPQSPYNTKEPYENITLELMASLKNASVYSALTQWFNNNLGYYKKYIANSEFCTDVSFGISENNVRYSNTYNRVFVDNTPDLYCSGSVYSLNVGLLSADEIVLAGAYRNVTNTKYYLYNEAIKGSYITLSSYSINDEGLQMVNVMSTGAFGNGLAAKNNVSLRPVISIGQNAKVKGEGTKENPYVIVA